MKVSTCFFALSFTLLVLVSFPFIAACLYTMLTRNPAAAEDFLANQQIILQCLLEYVKVLGELFAKTNEQVLVALDQYNSALMTLTPKVVSLFIATLTELLNVSTLILVSSLLVIYGLVFQFAVIKGTVEDLLRPILEAIKEVWLSIKGAVVTIWSLSPASCMSVMVIYALMLISDPERLKTFVQSS